MQAGNKILFGVRTLREAGAIDRLGDLVEIAARLAHQLRVHILNREAITHADRPHS